MKTYINKTLGFSFALLVPESVEEFDRLAGKGGAALDEANKNVIYRSVNHEFRKEFCEALEKTTGIEREGKITGEGEAAKKVYTEKEKAYVSRVLASGKITEEAAQSLANEVGGKIAFDPSPSERSSKLPKEIDDNVRAIFAAIAAGQSTEERVMANVAGKLGLGSYEDTYGEFNEETLGAALVAVARKQREEQRNELLG